jgi:hypothetical protein
MNNNEVISSVDCCIAGGGPGGVVLGLLLARRGVEVLLLEAHQNFDRDFRGDTVHPSTVQLLEQIGPRLLQGTLRVADLAAVQRRRELPTRLLQAMQRQMSPFTSNGRPKLQPPLLPRLAMALPPVADLRRRLISFGGWQPERVHDPAPACRPRGLDFASYLGRGLWNAMCQIDPRAFAMFGLPMYFADTPPQQPETAPSFLCPVAAPSSLLDSEPHPAWTNTVGCVSDLPPSEGGPS